MSHHLEALVFGSLGTVADTSAVHLDAFNRTFADLGLEWEWSEQTYQRLLRTPGEEEQILTFARDNGDTSVTPSTAAELKKQKAKVYAELVDARPAPIVRPGVERLLRSAADHGLQVGLATSRPEAEVETNLGVTHTLHRGMFHAVTTMEELDREKPAPDAHVVCLSRLGVRPSRTIVIEDSGWAVAAASIAGTTVVATPNEYSGSHDFSSAAVTVSSLGDPDRHGFIIGDGPELDHGMVTLPWLQNLFDVVG